MTNRLRQYLAIFGLSLSGFGCNYDLDGIGDAAQIRSALLAADQAMPKTLAETYLFRGEDTTRPAAGVHAYDVKVPLWSDGAHKKRFIFVPPGQRIEVDPSTGSFLFPVGTTLAKHFTTGTDPKLPVETRVMTLKENGKWSFATYVWSQDQSTTELNTRPRKVSKGGLEHRIPSEQECKMCHHDDTAVLGFTLAQLDLPGRAGKDQIAKLVKYRVFSSSVTPVRPIKSLADITDLTLSSTDRARSYMEVNCAPCHHPNGVEKANKLDLRITASDTHLLSEGKIIPGKPEESVMWKLIAASTERMPLISLRPDPLGIEILGKYIKEWPSP